MRFLISLLLCASVVSAKHLDDVVISGKVVNINEKTIELKTEKATLIIPKDLVKAKNLQTQSPLDLTVSQKDMNRITPKL